MIRRFLPAFLFTLIISIAASTNSIAQTTYWWNDAVFYEAFVRSYYDTNGDGVGDLQGLTNKLSYLNELGVNAIWLMPVCASPSYHGYDVTNYKAVQPAYGTKQQYINFVDSAHKRGIKVIFDFVMNHTSSAHPWFQHAEVNDPFYHDFYVWSPTNPGITGPWGQQVWYFHNSTVGYYYALFWDQMPDLNYYTPAVHDSMFSVAEFWLDSMHVDGFRLDAAPYLYEDGNRLFDCPQTLQFWHDFHTYYKGIKDSAMTVGEVWFPTDTILQYVVGGDKLDFCFEFPLASQIINAFNSGNPAGLKSEMQYDYNQFPYLQFGTFLTNHDQDRVLDDLSGNIPKMKAAAAIYLTIPGIPFIYYGEEIGMSGSGADENKRKPMQWTSGTHAGFTTGNPWEALNSNYATYNVATEETDSASLLNWYKKLISLRRGEPALQRGNYIAAASGPAAVFAFLREYGSDTDLVMVNTGSQTISGFTINLNGSNIQSGYKLFSDLLNGTGEQVGMLDGSHNLGTFTIGPFGTLIYRMESSTGVNNISSNDAVKIFPNPASEQITIQMKSDGNFPLVSIYDTQGKILRQERLNVPGGKSTVDVSELPNGIYILKVEEEKAMSYFTIAVVR